MVAGARARVALAVIALAYAALIVPLWGATYWDFGDGNYLYIARRVNEGAVLYRDILAPQPPLHTLTGCVALRVGEVVGDARLGPRAMSLLLRLLTAWVVSRIARRMFAGEGTAVLAFAMTLAMPIGLWWGIGYQSENLEVALLLFAVWRLLDWTPRGAALAGVASALAMHTNMTAAPYFIVNAIFLACRRRELLLPYCGTALGVWGLGAGAAHLATGGYYLDNVILNQVGTFPRSDVLAEMRGDPDYGLLDYALEKIAREGGKVVAIEGLLIAAACVALAGRVGGRGWGEAGQADGGSVRTGDAAAAAPVDRGEVLRREFLAWSAIGHWLSICFVSKGGTVNYIFVIGEPFVALYAADALAGLWRRAWPPVAQWRRLSFSDTQAFLRVAFAAVATALAFAGPADNIRATLSQEQSELPGGAVLEVRRLILAHARPGDTILAPPFYAFDTGTRVAGELAENYIWQIKYMNERRDGVEGLAVRKMEEVASILAERRAAILLLDMAQTGLVPEIAAAANAHYVELPPGTIRTRNTTLRVMVPRR